MPRACVTTEQKQLIHNLYATTNNGYKVAQQMSLGNSTVYKHLCLHKCFHPPWSDDEIQIMIDGYLEKRSINEMAKKVGRSPQAVKIKMCRYRKQVRKDPKKRRALSAISMAFKAVRKADIFRELEE